MFSSQAQSGQLRWVACWAAEVWIKGRADVFPVPPPSTELWTSLCVYSWPQHASVLHSSQQLAAALSQASSVCWSPLCQGQIHDYDLFTAHDLVPSFHPVLSCFHWFARSESTQLTACLNPYTWVDPKTCHCSRIRTVLYFRQVCAHACLLTLFQGRCGELRQTGHVSSVGVGWGGWCVD